MPRTLGSPILDSASASKTYGVATLSSGVVTISTTSVKTASVIIVTSLGGGTLANAGLPVVQQTDIVDGTSFMIRSLNLITGVLNIIDNNKVAWMLLDPTNNP